MDKLLQRSNGKIDIELLDNNFQKFFQSGCCKILNPKNYNAFKELVLINTAGGIACNDNIEFNATINNSQLSVCTQAAEKIYAGIGDPARVEININLNNSTLYWLPKELILFDNSKLRRNININLSDNSNLIFCETTILGRKAMSEKIKNISFSDQWKIFTNSSIKHFEAINIKGSTIDNFKNNYTFSNQSSLATILIFGGIVHQLESVLRKVTKNLKNHYCEMTKFDDKIIIRSLADDNYDLKKTLNFIMKNIINDKLPKSWDL
jgi:urease accessory protein